MYTWKKIENENAVEEELDLPLEQFEICDADGVCLATVATQPEAEVLVSHLNR